MLSCFVCLSSFFKRSSERLICLFSFTLIQLRSFIHIDICYNRTLFLVGNEKEMSVFYAMFRHALQIDDIFIVISVVISIVISVFLSVALSIVLFVFICFVVSFLFSSFRLILVLVLVYFFGGVGMLLCGCCFQ